MTIFDEIKKQTAKEFAEWLFKEFDIIDDTRLTISGKVFNTPKELEEYLNKSITEDGIVLCSFCKYDDKTCKETDTCKKCDLYINGACYCLALEIDKPCEKFTPKSEN